MELKSVSLKIPKDCSLETLASQLQSYSNKYLYVIDGIYLSFVSRLDEIPMRKRVLEATSDRKYYIRDVDNQEMICVFDERFRNRLLGLELPEIRLPVVASFIPVSGPSVIEPEMSLKSISEGKMIDTSTTIEPATPVIKVERII